jgi:hypothetical protein
VCKKFFDFPSFSDGCQFGDGRDFYEVSELGRVRSIPRKGGRNRSYGGGIRACTPDRHGYPMVVLSAPGRRRSGRHIHRLVLEAFAWPPPAPGMEACHDNGRPDDPRLVNLRWYTHKGNMADMIRHGTRPFGDHHWNAKLSDADVREIRRLWESCLRPGHRHSRWCGCAWTQGTLASRFGVARSRITTIVTGGERLVLQQRFVICECGGKAFAGLHGSAWASSTLRSTAAHSAVASR